MFVGSRYIKPPLRNWQWWGWIGATLAASLLLGGDEAIALTSKFVLSKWVFSTSDGAQRFFLATTALLLVAATLPPHPAFSLWGRRLLLVGFLVGYSANLAATLLYFHHFDIPLSARLFHWDSGNNTFMSLTHSHIGKAALSILPETWWANTRYDVGAVLTTMIPTPFFWGIVFGFLCAAIGALCFMPHFWRQFGHRGSCAALWFLAITLSLKGLIDGGLLAYATPPALLLLLSFVITPDTEKWQIFWRRQGAIAAVVLSVGYATLDRMLTVTDSPPLWGPWLFLLAFFALLVLPKAGRGRWVTRASLILYLGTNFLFAFGDQLAPLLRKTTPTTVFVDFASATPDTRPSVTVAEAIPIYRLYQMQGDDPWKPNHLLVAESTAGKRTLTAAILPLEWQGTKGTFLTAPYLGVMVEGLLPNGWVAIRFSVPDDFPLPLITTGNGGAIDHNNFYVWLYQIDGLLRASGWTSYLFIALE